ncbi:unnamed protein product [Ostreobium quekettii]|uniref:Uncharacterized protein n=1 Tax=Ostreobium quekettii TaxID=121088 RepID=A0A8S1J4J5_9CHLO|nr:unnamed protein product [Ostreobium quekettii]|eukprot:evm.model.scf_13EXC.3 EVM.evm.TU.scf_13EXC.3   scf_13EXC:84289-87703(-)
MCHGEYHASVNLQPYPSGRNRDMFVAPPISEGGTETVAAPQRRPALVSSSTTARRDAVPRGARRDERAVYSRRSGDVAGFFFKDGQLSTRATAPGGLLAQLQSGDEPCTVLADCQEPGAGDVVVEWGLIRDHLDKINRLGSAEVSVEAAPKALFDRTTSSPCGQLALLRRGAQGLISGQAPEVAADGSEVEGTFAPPDGHDTVPADGLALGRAQGSTGPAQDVCQSQLSTAAGQPHTNCSLQPDGKRTGVFDIKCESRADEGSGPVVKMQGMCPSQPNALLADPVLAAKGQKECEPMGSQCGQLGMGNRRTAADAGGGKETYPGKAGEVQSMVDELLSATSSALDTNLQTSVELSSLKSKFQSLLDDIHAMQSSVGSRTAAPQPQGAGCKDVAASLHPTPGIVKACSRASSQEMDVASVSFAGGDSDSNQDLSEDWDSDVLEAASHSDDDASGEDIWSEWSYDAEEAGAARTSAIAAAMCAGLDFQSSPSVGGPGTDAVAGDDPIRGLVSVSSDESLTCLVERDAALVSLYRDDPQACALAGRQEANSPDMMDCMRWWSPLLGAEEIGQGEEDGQHDQPASVCGDHSCQCDVMEAVMDYRSKCGGPEEVAIVTPAVSNAFGTAKTVACDWQNSFCLPREIFIAVDKGFEEALRVGAFNHFEGWECREAEDWNVGLCMGSNCAEMIRGYAGEKDLALVCAGHIGCSMKSHDGCADSGTCPTSKRGYALSEMEYIAPQGQRPQEWSRIIITDYKLFLDSWSSATGSGIVGGSTAMVLPPPWSPAGLRGRVAAAPQLSWIRPNAADLVLADGLEVTALTANLSPRRSALMLGPPRGFADVRRLSLAGLRPDTPHRLLGAPTDACIHVDSPLNMPWFSSSLLQKVQLDQNPLPISQDDVNKDDVSSGGEQDGDSSEDNDTISASGWEPGLWGTDCKALRVAGYRLNSCDLAAWGSSKRGLPRTGHSDTRAMMQYSVGGMPRKYDGRGICTLQISMERPARGAGGRLQHGMCIHNTGNGQTCVWCTPAWKQKVQLRSLVDTGAQNFWSLLCRRTQNACKLFMHWWAVRVEKRFRDFQFGVFN